MSILGPLIISLQTPLNHFNPIPLATYASSYYLLLIKLDHNPS